MSQHRPRRTLLSGLAAAGGQIAAKAALVPALPKRAWQVEIIC